MSQVIKSSHSIDHTLLIFLYAYYLAYTMFDVYVLASVPIAMYIDSIMKLVMNNNHIAPFVKGR